MKKLSVLDELIKKALEEDIASGDITTIALVEKDHVSKAVIFCKQDALICGVEIVKSIFHFLDKKLAVHALVKDGQKIKKNQRVFIIKGRTRALLSAERVALNFLSYLSAIATKTHIFVNKIKPYKTRILDTRKTTPTLRFLERYAVRCGGGFNHRDNLSDMAMIKDNHLLLKNPGASIKDSVESVRKHCDVSVEVEVDNLSQLKEALESTAEVILLDNMTTAMIRRAIKTRDRLQKRVLLEASGGINLSNVRRYAQTGVDRISIGELTHSRNAIDFSMEIMP